MKTLYTPYSSVYSSFYFNLNKFDFFKTSETTTNDLHIYFWLYNSKETQDTVNIGYCSLQSCSGYSDFSNLSASVAISAQSFKEVKIIIKSNTASTFDVTVDSSQAETLSLTDFTFRVNSSDANIGVTNFRFYLSK